MPEANFSQDYSFILAREAQSVVKNVTLKVFDMVQALSNTSSRFLPSFGVTPSSSFTGLFSLPPLSGEFDPTTLAKPTQTNKMFSIRP